MTSKVGKMDMEASKAQTLSVGVTSQIEKAKKDIVETAKKCETEIVEYAAQEIQKCKNRTLNYIDGAVKKITAETSKRRIELVEHLAKGILQGYAAFCLVIEWFQKHKKDTLNIFQEDALRQVDNTVNKIAKTANNLTMRDFVRLVERQLNQILKDTRKHAVDRLDMFNRELKYI